MSLRPLIPLTAVMSLLAPASASADFMHTVMPGESLTSIAAADGISVSELAAANGLPTDAQLTLGTSVAIPPQSGPSLPTTAASATSAEATWDGDSDDPEASSTAPASTSASSGSYVVQPGDTLTGIASRAGTSVAALAAANGLSTNGVLPAGITLRLSGSTAGTTASSSTTSAPTSASYVVQPGDTLSGIASRSGTSVDALAAANGINPNGVLLIGKTLTLSGSSTGTSATSAPTPASYVVQPGDTLTGIASRSGTSVDALAAANGMSPNDVLLIGKTLTLSGSSTGTSATSAPTPASYVVQPGDTLTGIASREGVSVDALAAANGLDPNGVLPAGMTLQFGGSGSSSVPSQAPAVGTTITGRMTWFGGPNDPSAQGQPASGLGFLSNGMSYYNEGSLGNNWQIHFPWGQSLNMKQIDIGPAPWTGNQFDMAYSALPSTPYNESTWPNPTVTGTYLGP